MNTKVLSIMLLAIGIMLIGWGYSSSDSLSFAVPRAQVRPGTGLSAATMAELVQPLSGSSALFAGLTVLGPALDAGILPLR